MFSKRSIFKRADDEIEVPYLGTTISFTEVDDIGIIERVSILCNSIQGVGLEFSSLKEEIEASFDSESMDTSKCCGRQG